MRNLTICSQCGQTSEDVPHSKYCDKIQYGLPDGKNEHRYVKLEQETNKLIYKLRILMAKMTPEEILILLSKIKEGFCTYCGRDSTPCHCMNDE